VRIGSVIEVPEVLGSLGADPVEVLAEVGIDIELFNDPNNRIPFQARTRMMAHCADRTGCPHFGFLVGQKTGLPSFGLVGLLAKYSPNVELALDSLIRYFHLHVRGAKTTLSVESDLAVLEYQIYQAGTVGNDQVGAAAVAAAFNIIRDLCGRDWKPVEVRFAHRKPDDLVPFRQFFGVSPRFNTGQYAVVFSASWLDQDLPYTSPELLHLLQKEINKLEERQEDNFREQVCSLLRTTLVTGHCSANQIAELFSIHRRTLNRRLNAYGTSFHKLVDEIRFEIARQLLEDSSLEITQIALVLGYSSSSVFTRSFRRWSSTTPTKWRATARGSV